MSNEAAPYVQQNPGDLITAENWNSMQIQIKQDIAGQIREAIGKLDNVPNADNARKLENQTAKDLANGILEKVRQEIPKRTGYKMLFKKLKTGVESVIEHDLGAMPLTEICQLDYFKVVCSEDEEKYPAWTTFYLYHSSEKKLRHTAGAPPATESIDIESTESRPYRIRLSDLLSLYQVEYTDASTLADVETEFWDAFFASPSDSMDDEDYCHSPWFDRCCHDLKIVGDLKKRGDWDELWFQMRPRRTFNLEPAQHMAPSQIQLVHFDFGSLGIKLLAKPQPQPPPPNAALLPLPDVEKLNVMVLLKV